MYPQHNIVELVYQRNTPMLSREFDRFELNNDLSTSLHEADKANGQYGKQAVDSTKIGADQTAIGEKKVEKKTDRKILQHDKKELNEDSSAANQ